jgi:hypothetical protein
MSADAVVNFESVQNWVLLNNVRVSADAVVNFESVCAFKLKLSKVTSKQYFFFKNLTECDRHLSKIRRGCVLIV